MLLAPLILSMFKAWNPKTTWRITAFSCMWTPCYVPTLCSFFPSFQLLLSNHPVFAAVFKAAAWGRSSNVSSKMCSRFSPAQSEFNQLDLGIVLGPKLWHASKRALGYTFQLFQECVNVWYKRDLVTAIVRFHHEAQGREARSCGADGKKERKIQLERNRVGWPNWLWLSRPTDQC